MKYLFIILVTVASHSNVHSCKMFLKDFRDAKEKASMHIEYGSSKQIILYQLELAKNSLISATVECKPYKKQKNINEMKIDIKKIVDIIKDARAW